MDIKKISYAKNEFDKLNSYISLSSEHGKMIVFAHNENNELAHIDSVSNGKACKCRCLSCGETLIARQGIRAHSFAHESGTECQHAYETMLHWLAKELISQNHFFSIPEDTAHVLMNGPLRPISLIRTIPSETLNVDTATLEKRVNPIRPDIVLKSQGKEYLIEIAVTHKADAKKISIMKSLGLPSIEIDLSKHILKSISDLEQILFYESKLKKWLFNPKIAAIQESLNKEALDQLEIQNSEFKKRLADKEKAEKENIESKEKDQKIESKKIEQPEKSELHEVLAKHNNLTEEQVQYFHTKNFHTKNFQKLLYTTNDGALCFHHSSIKTAYCIPSTGTEKALEILHKMHITFDPIIKGYSFDKTLLSSIQKDVIPFMIKIRSI